MNADLNFTPFRYPLPEIEGLNSDCTHGSLQEVDGLLYCPQCEIANMTILLGEEESI